MGRMPKLILILALTGSTLASARGLAQAPKTLPPVDATPSAPAEVLALPDLPRVPDAPGSFSYPPTGRVKPAGVISPLKRSEALLSLPIV